METNLFIAVISASGSVLVATLTYFLSKRKDREEERRGLKIEYYKEFFRSLSNVIQPVSNDPRTVTKEDHQKLADVSNSLILVASPNVIKALYDYRNEVKVSNKNKTQKKHDETITKLLLEIRKDIGVSNIGFGSEFTVLLWSGS